MRIEEMHKKHEAKNKIYAQFGIRVPICEMRNICIKFARDIFENICYKWVITLKCGKQIFFREELDENTKRYRIMDFHIV